VRSSRLWPRGLPGGPDDHDPKPDPAAARQALAACGRADGFDTLLATPDATGSVDLAKTLADQLAEVGIHATVTPLKANRFYAKDVGNPDNVKAKGYGIILATWTADFPTPGSFLAPLVDGRSVKPVGNTNYARLTDAGVDGLVDTARKATDAGAAAKAWTDVATAAAKTGAYVPLAETRVQLVAGQRLRNGLVMQPYGSYDLATAGVV
jgi:peptide/nickel transport system substrate-binding protein